MTNLVFATFAPVQTPDPRTSTKTDASALVAERRYLAEIESDSMAAGRVMISGLGLPMTNNSNSRNSARTCFSMMLFLCTSELDGNAENLWRTKTQGQRWGSGSR
jgi:hypothetical protein